MDAKLRALEDAAMRSNFSLRLDMCRTMGIDDETLSIWQAGHHLDGHEGAAHYDMGDYPSVRAHPREAAAELDRLTDEGKIYWYGDHAPSDLDICPTTLILNNNRARLVHDWTRAGLNELLVNPRTQYHSMDDFLSHLMPGSFMAGLDIKDCFYHWPIHGDSRRRLGVRHPLTGKKGSTSFYRQAWRRPLVITRTLWRKRSQLQARCYS